jgi:hypothetical protein
MLAAGDPMRSRRYFKSYRRQAARRFYEVDLSLLHLCEEFRRSTESLAAVIGMYR